METGYVHESLEGNLKRLVYYADRRKIPGIREDPDEWHKFETFFLKDFPEAEKGLAIQGQGVHGNISREEPAYKTIYQERLVGMQERADQVEYHPWPHKKPGV